MGPTMSETDTILAELRSISTRLDRVVTAVEGPDDQRERGLLTRVDRIEQSAGWIKWAVGLGISGIFGAVANWFRPPQH